MEPISLAMMLAASGRVVDALLGDSANKLVSAIVGGVIGNRADDAVKWAANSSWNFFRNLRTEDPELNHDLERASREAYLVATLEMVRQAELRTEVGTSGSRLMTSGDAEALERMRRGVESDFRDAGNTLPEALTDAHLFLVDPKVAPGDRTQRLRETLRRNLDQDVVRWIGGGLPRAVEQLLAEGWSIDTQFRKSVARDWYSLIAIAFMEKLKSEPRVAAVFESKLLAEIAVREPAVAPVATFAGFAGEFEKLAAPLQRVEDALGVVRRDVAEIKEQVRETGADVREIKQSLSLLRVVPPWAWVSILGLLLAGAAGFATDAGARMACGVPGVRMLCGQMGIGGAPSAREEALWNGRSPGDCEPLRTYLAQFPSGSYAEEAARRLGGVLRKERERWVAEEKSHVFTVRPALEPAPTEEAARAAALVRAEKDAAAACSAYSQGEYRLKAAQTKAEEWRCSKREAGFHCGFDGTVVCEVEGRRADVVERCP